MTPASFPHGCSRPHRKRPLFPQFQKSISYLYPASGRHRYRAFQARSLETAISRTSAILRVQAQLHLAEQPTHIQPAYHFSPRVCAESPWPPAQSADNTLHRRTQSTPRFSPMTRDLSASNVYFTNGITNNTPRDKAKPHPKGAPTHPP